MKRDTGYTDKKGVELYEGDIVKFYYDEFLGHWTEGCGESKSDYTEMVDVVWFNEADESKPMLVCDVGWAAYIWRHNEYCEKIGDVYSNPELRSIFLGYWIKEIFLDKVEE